MYQVPQLSDESLVRQSKQCNALSICHVCGGLAWAGAEAQVSTLLRGLSKYPELTLHAIVFAEGRLAQTLRADGIDVFVADEPHKNFGRVISECLSFVDSRNVQVLHSHCYKENILSFLLARGCKVQRQVRTEHGHPEPYSPLRNLKHWTVLTGDRMAARYASDRIVAVSSDLARYWSLHTDPHKVTVIRNGVDLEHVVSRLTPADAKHRLGYSSGDFVIGIVGRVESIKRHDLFVATAKFLSSKISSFKYLIAGSGRLKDSVLRSIDASNLQDRVAFLGERSDTYDVLRAMDVLLICSDHEGIPMTMLESMALGVAVVSRDVGGISEVIRDGLNGILVSSASPEALAGACLLLFEKAEYRARLTHAAYQTIRKLYSADKNADSMYQLYRSMCFEGAS
jgi:L-malate glycosyltransferase